MSYEDFEEIIFNDLDDNYVRESINEYFEFCSISGYEQMMGIFQTHIEHDKIYGPLEDAADEAAGVSEYDTTTPDIDW